MEKERRGDVGTFQPARHLPPDKQQDLALIQISIGLAGNIQMEQWLDLELTVEKTKGLLAWRLGTKASHVEIVAGTRKGQDSDLLREALGEARELTLILVQDSDSDSDVPPPLASASSDDEDRLAAQAGEEEISQTSSGSTESVEENWRKQLRLVRAALGAVGTSINGR